MALIQKIISSITMVLPLSAFWITIFLFLDECLEALKSDAVKFSDGHESLENFNMRKKLCQVI